MHRRVCVRAREREMPCTLQTLADMGSTTANVQLLVRGRPHRHRACRVATMHVETRSELGADQRGRRIRIWPSHQVKGMNRHAWVSEQHRRR